MQDYEVTKVKATLNSAIAHLDDLIGWLVGVDDDMHAKAVTTQQLVTAALVIITED